MSSPGGKRVGGGSNDVGGMLGNLDSGMGGEELDTLLSGMARQEDIYGVGRFEDYGGECGMSEITKSSISDSTRDNTINATQASV